MSSHRPGRAAVFLVAMLLLMTAAGCSSGHKTSGQHPPSTPSTLGPVSQGSSSGYSPLSAADVLHIAGSGFVTASGKRVGLFGYKFSAASECVSRHGAGSGIWVDGPPNETSVRVIQNVWHADAVRIPLNEDCWLGINGANPAYSGSNYQESIIRFVDLLNQNGLYVLLDLHWNAPGNQLATGQEVMADADHSPAFWSSVASAFKSNPFVMFELYNEPHLGQYNPTGADWECWLQGCSYAGKGGTWQTAGMQSLVDAVRSTGADQILIVNGLSWANSLSEWLQYRPTDPLHKVVAGFHLHDNPGQLYLTAAGWDAELPPILAAGYPVVATEIAGPKDNVQFVSNFVTWADQHGISYLGWTDKQTSGANDFSTVLDNHFAELRTQGDQ